MLYCHSLINIVFPCLSAKLMYNLNLTYCSTLHLGSPPLKLSCKMIMPRLWTISMFKLLILLLTLSTHFTCLHIFIFLVLTMGPLVHNFSICHYTMPASWHLYHYLIHNTVINVIHNMKLRIFLYEYVQPCSCSYCIFTLSTQKNMSNTDTKLITAKPRGGQLFDPTSYYYLKATYYNPLVVNNIL